MTTRTAVYPSYDVSYNRRGSISTMMSRNVEDDTTQGVTSLANDALPNYARSGPMVVDHYRAASAFADVLGPGYNSEAKEREHSRSHYINHQHPPDVHMAELQAYSGQSTDRNPDTSIRVDEDQREVDGPNFYATSRSVFGVGSVGVQGLLSGAFRFFKTLAQRNQYILTTPLQQELEVGKNRGDTSGEQCLQRPPMLRLLCFGGGLTLTITSAFRLLNVLMLFTNFSAYIIYGFQTFFGLCMMLVEANNDWDSFEHLRPWIAQWLRFLTVPAGKGFFYIFVGALGLSSRLWANSFFGSVLGLYILGLGVISIILYFKGGPAVPLSNQGRKPYSTTHVSQNLAMAVSPEHFAYPDTMTEGGDDDYDWNSVEDGRVSRLTQPFDQRGPHDYSLEQGHSAPSNEWNANWGNTQPSRAPCRQERATERVTSRPFVKEETLSVTATGPLAPCSRSQHQRQQRACKISSSTSSGSSPPPFSNEEGQRYMRDSRNSAIPPRVKAGGHVGQRSGQENQLHLNRETDNGVLADEAQDNITTPHRKEYEASYIPSMPRKKGIHRSNATIVGESGALEKDKRYPKTVNIGEADEEGPSLAYEPSDSEVIGNRYYIPDTTATGATSAASSYTREVTVGY